MGISRSASTPAHLAVRARLKAQRVVCIGPDVPLVPPTHSWWIGPASEFSQRARQELTQMRRSKVSSAVSGSVTGVEQERPIRR